jgi:hypothetical protein
MIERLLKILFNNFGYKVAAFAISILIWAIIQGQEIHEINKRLIVNLTIPEGYAIVGSQQRFLSISLRGPKLLLAPHLQNQIKIDLPVPIEKMGRVEIPFGPEMIAGIDPRILINFKGSSVITVVIGEKDEKRVAVKEVLIGAPAEGYFIESVTVKPSRVLVSGIRSAVATVSELTTQTIDIRGLNQSKAFNAPLNSIEGVGYEVDEVEVFVQVADSKVNKTFYNIPVDLVGAKLKSICEPSHVAIMLQSTPGVFTTLVSDQLQAFIDVSALKPGKHELDVKVKIPAETVLIETKPNRCKVNVTSFPIGESL